MEQNRLTVTRVYTIGHSGHDVRAFFDLLDRHQITILLDVRSAPYSKFVPHFNKQLLEAECKTRGIEYRYGGQVLGGRPEDAESYRDGQVPDPEMAREKYLKQVDYLAIMKQQPYRRGIARLLELAQSAAVVVMCSEGNPVECHRHHLIARSLIDPLVRVTAQAVEVAHILKEGTLEIVNPDVFVEPPKQLELF